MSSLLFFDIEIAKLDSFDPKDYELHRSENANFDFWPETNKVICVSVSSSKEDYKPRSLIWDEASILQEIMDLITDHSFVIGYNIQAFDLPFLAKRCVINSLPICQSLKAYDRKPWNVEYIIDLYLAWKHWAQKACTLDLLCRTLNLPTPKESMDGSMVDEYFRAGRIDEIAKYCEADVIATMQVYKRFKQTNLI